MAVSYDYYRVFYHVARCGSFTRAADALLSNQPNITRVINNLEQELGCRLFLRSRRGVTLTPEGERLYARVQVAQEQIQAAEYELAQGRRLQSGYVSLGASETALHGLLLPVLRQFRRSYPGVHIQITNHSTPQAVAAVRSGLVELAVVTSPTGLDRPLLEVPLRSFQDILIAGQDYAPLRGRVLHLRDLGDYPLICLGRETKTFEFFSRLFGRYNLVLRPDIEAATTGQILPMVKSGLGLGLLPQIFTLEAMQKEEIFQIHLAEPIPCRGICLVKDRGRPLSIAALELEKMIVQAAQPLGATPENLRLN